MDSGWTIGMWGRIRLCGRMFGADRLAQESESRVESGAMGAGSSKAVMSPDDPNLCNKSYAIKDIVANIDDFTENTSLEWSPSEKKVMVRLANVRSELSGLIPVEAERSERCSFAAMGGAYRKTRRSRTHRNRKTRRHR